MALTSKNTRTADCLLDSPTDTLALGWTVNQLSGRDPYENFALFWDATTIVAQSKLQWYTK